MRHLPLQSSGWSSEARPCISVGSPCTAGSPGLALPPGPARRNLSSRTIRSGGRSWGRSGCVFGAVPAMSRGSMTCGGSKGKSCRPRSRLGRAGNEGSSAQSPARLTHRITSIPPRLAPEALNTARTGVRCGRRGPGAKRERRPPTPQRWTSVTADGPGGRRDRPCRGLPLSDPVARSVHGRLWEVAHRREE
jgi:hypothetical protein